MSEPVRGAGQEARVMTETPHADRAERSGRGRTTVVWALIVVASIIGCTASATVWVKRQALDTNQWVKASDKLLDEPQIRTALSVYLVDQLYQNVDVGGQLQQLLPNHFKNLARPSSAALRGPATEAVERLLASSQFRARWEQLNRTAHQTLVNILEDKTKFSSTANGVVTLDLGELVRQLGQALGLPSGVLDRIPPDAGKIVVARSDQLAAAQKTYKVIKVASALLFILVIGLYALAVYLAHDRRKAIRNVGWAEIGRASCREKGSSGGPARQLK